MLIAMTVLALSGAAAPADRSFASPSDLQRWLTDYHRRPRPELVVAALVALETELPRHGSTLEAQAARGGMRSFFGLVLAKSPAAVRAVEQHDFEPGTRRFLAEALWRCGTTPCTAALARLRVEPAASATPAPDVRVAPVDTAAAVDDLWASYSATGDTVYVERVIDALPPSAEVSDPPRAIAAGAALWSLVSNAAQDGDVLAVCVAAARRADPPRRAVLEDVVRRARLARGDGPGF